MGPHRRPIVYKHWLVGAWLACFATEAASAVPYSCEGLLDITVLEMIPNLVEKYGGGLNSARGEPKKFIPVAIGEDLHQTLSKYALRAVDRDAANTPPGMRLGTTTYYPRKATREDVIEWLKSIPQEYRLGYAQALREFYDGSLDGNRVRMRAYLVGKVDTNPYLATDVNRGFELSATNVFRDGDREVPFFFLEWKVKQSVHSGVDLSEDNPNRKPSMPLAVNTFKQLWDRKIDGPTFAKQATAFYVQVRDAARSRGRPLKDDWSEFDAYQFFRKMSVYFEFLKAKHAVDPIEQRVTYMRQAIEYTLQTQIPEDAAQIAAVQQSLKKLHAGDAIGGIHAQALGTLASLAGESLGKFQSDGTLHIRFQLTRDNSVFFENVGQRMDRPDWRGIIDAERSLGFAEQGYGFTELKLPVSWLKLLKLAEENPDVQTLLQAYVPNLLAVRKAWRDTQDHQYAGFSANRGKIAFGTEFLSTD